MSNKYISEIRVSGSDAAIIFLHGFTGKHKQTWNQFFPLLLADPFFDGWDVLSLGYPSSIKPGITGWHKDPSIKTIATYIKTIILTKVKEYKVISIVAHSMGGLVAQQLCVEHPELSAKITSLIHYGTPSGGLEKARALGVFSKQARDMIPTGEFITTLRSKWTTFETSGRFPTFTTVAGIMDDFVPARSSLDPFDPEYHKVILGNHLQIVAPAKHSSDSFDILKHHMSDKEHPLSPLLSAALAVERLDFHAAISQYQAHYEYLSEEDFVQYALALEGVGRPDEAIRVLEKNYRKGTDAQGVLAGRLKRRWLNGKRPSDAERAYELYSSAFFKAEQVDDSPQCHYHAINAAFMALAYSRDRHEAEKWAKEALAHAACSPEDGWSEATKGEAYLYLGDHEKAFAAYIKALKSPGSFTLRDVTSILFQISNICDLEGCPEFEDGIYAELGLD